MSNITKIIAKLPIKQVADLITYHFSRVNSLIVVNAITYHQFFSDAENNFDLWKLLAAEEKRRILGIQHLTHWVHFWFSSLILEKIGLLDF